MFPKNKCDLKSDKKYPYKYLLFWKRKVFIERNLDKIQWRENELPMNSSMNKAFPGMEKKAEERNRKIQDITNVQLEQ